MIDNHPFDGNANLGPPSRIADLTIRDIRDGINYGSSCGEFGYVYEHPKLIVPLHNTSNAHTIRQAILNSSPFLLITHLCHILGYPFSFSMS